MPLSPGSSSQPGPVIDTLTPTLRWEGVEGADYYALAISVYPYGPENVVYNPQQVYGTSHRVPEGVLEYGKKYRWNMQAHNSGGWSDISNTLYFQTPQPPAQRPVELITNGSFSEGAKGWSVHGDFWAGTGLPNYRTSPGYAAGGVDVSGRPINNGVGWMYQTVTIPSDISSATLTFWYNITSEETSTVGHDVLNVTIQDSSGHYLATVAILSNVDKSSLGNYRQINFDLTPYKGRTLRINFSATTNDSKHTVFRIDDVSLRVN